MGVTIEATVELKLYDGPVNYPTFSNHFALLLIIQKNQLQGCCLTNISGAEKGKSQKVRGPTGTVFRASAKI